MAPHPRPPITDSPWFYVLAFSLTALLAILVISPKYGRRQSAMDRNFQARTRVAEKQVAGNNSTAPPRKDHVADQHGYSTPDDTLVPLWPLATILILIALFATHMLRRGRRALPAATGPSAKPPPNESHSP